MLSSEEGSPEGQADLPPETNENPLGAVAAMEADLWEALVAVLAKYRNQPNSAMTAITALVNFQRSIDGELIALEKDSRMEAGQPMFDKPESDDRYIPAGIDLDAYGPCSIFECDHPELAYTPEELDRVRRSLASIFEPEGEQ